MRWDTGLKRPKYGARKTVVDGITFDSAKEAARFGELKLLERTGAIRNLELQPKFPVVINGVKVFEYWGDFRYEEKGRDALGLEEWRTVYEDCKGYRTDAYRIKKKCVEASYRILIRET